MVYHRVLSATSWLVTIRVWIDGYHIISVEDITKSYEISWKENMNSKFPWYCIGHKICQHQWLININLSFFLGDLHCFSGQCIAIHLCQCTDMYRGLLISVHHDAPVNRDTPTGWPMALCMYHYCFKEMSSSLLIFMFVYLYNSRNGAYEKNLAATQAKLDE